MKKGLYRSHKNGLGISWETIAKLMNCSSITARRFIKKQKEENNIENLELKDIGQIIFEYYKRKEQNSLQEYMKVLSK